MTIAVGLLSRESIVIAADSHETDYALKHRVGKITIRGRTVEVTGTRQFNALAMTGAGDAHYLDAFMDRVHAFHASSPTASLADLEQAIEARLLAFYAAHVLPFPPADNWGDHNVQTIIAARTSDGARMLWKTYLNTVIPVQGAYCAVGVGATWANMILKDAYPWQLDTKGAVLAAVHAVMATKDHVDYCGGVTDVVVIPNDGIFHIPSSGTIEQAEKVLRLYAEHEAKRRRFVMALRSDLLGNEQAPLEEIMSQLSQITFESTLPSWALDTPGS